MTEDVKGFFVFFSDKDSSKRITLLKSFVELSIVILYSKFTYLWLFGKYDLLDPTKFSDIYTFFNSGYLFVCILIFVFWFFIVRTTHFYVLYIVDYLIIGFCLIIVKLLRKIKIKEEKWLRIKVTPLSILLFLDVIKRDVKNNKEYIAGVHFDLFSNILKYLYYDSKGDLLKTTFQNVSLVIQFSLIFLLHISQLVTLPALFHLVLWVVLIYTFVNQILIFFLIENVLEKYGYRVFEILEGYKRYEHNYNSVLSSFNPDKPIFSDKQNLLLKRDYFSGVLYNSILNYTDKECLVIGIDGKWGDGKTSFVNMALENFIYNSKDGKYVLFFNPWNFTNPAELTTHFLNELKRYLRKILGNKYSNDLDSKLFLYINYITKGEFQAPEENSFQENDTESLKKEIDKVLRNLDFKLIVVIDDIDRLTGEETRQVFRFVKLVGDFPNIIYVIPFDKQKTIIESKIDEDYLQKIIQIEIKLPPVVSTEIYTIFNEKLKFLFNSVDVNGHFDFAEWNNSLSHSLRHYIKNLRDVNRTINTLKFYLSNNHTSDLNFNDFVVLTVIQVFDVGLYNFIGSNKTLFTYFEENGSVYSNGSKINYKEVYSNLLKSVEEKYNAKNANFYSVIYNLFPNLNLLSNNINFSDRNVRVSRREHRISSPTYFDRYFLYPIESDLLSKEEIERVLLNSMDLNLFKRDILRLINDNSFSFFIERSFDYLERSDLKVNYENIILGYLHIGKRLPDNKQNNTIVSFTLKSNTMYYLSKVLLDMSYEDRMRIYKRIFKDMHCDIDGLVNLYEKVCYENRVPSNMYMDRAFLDSNFKLEHQMNIMFRYLLKRYRKSFYQVCKSPRAYRHIHNWQKLDPNNQYILEILVKYLEKSDGNFILFFNQLKMSQKIESSNYGFQARDIYDIEYISKIMDINYFVKKSDELMGRINEIDILSVPDIVEFTINKATFDDCHKGKIDYKNNSWYEKISI